MNLRPRTWFLISIVLFIAAWCFWQLGEQRRAATQPHATTNSSVGIAPVAVTKSTAAAATVVYPDNLVVSGISTNLEHPASPNDYRVSNTTESFDDLALRDSALLLRNAWIDTASKQPLRIPAELRASGDPESYLVQAKGIITPSFRQTISSVGGTVVSYIPNNAYLVRVAAGGARKLANSPEVQSVLPYDPVYKLFNLMPVAMGHKANPIGKALRVTLFDGTEKAAAAGIAQLGAKIVGKDETPFGSQLIVSVPLSSDNTVVKLAQMNSVQSIEMYEQRILMNDLSRQRTRVAVNTFTNGNYLGLTGTNVLVNVNDTGAYSGHPDLSNRVYGVTNDLNGHGTHVVGTIISTGSNAPSGLVLTNFGSVTNASFRGMAPQASVFVLPFNADLSDNLDTFNSDAALAQIAARSNLFVFGKTNTLISNNSWGYGSRAYNSSAAIFDGAARDALPDVPGSQPVLFVFAAGNRGGAGDLCFPSETADSISSPATMKNGLAVGAVENLRKINSQVFSNMVQSRMGGNFNMYYTCDNCTFITNNSAFLGLTDSSNQVAGFSSRGNSGINSKSIGRFKPDVVAPGTFMVSTRPVGTNWAESSYYNPTNVIDGYTIHDIVLKSGQTNHFPPVIVPDNTVRISFVATSIPAFTNDLLVYAATSPSPSSVAGSFVGTNILVITNITTTNCYGDFWYVDVVNPSNQTAIYDFSARVFATNKGTVLMTLSNLNESLDTNHLYRFETGTSMAAPVVSGLAALMQEFFEQRLQRTNSPALMKALLINGARSVSSAYHLQTDPLVNQQGWGLVNIQNSIPSLLNTLSNTTDEAKWPIRFFDQDPTNALSTGQSHTYTLAMTNAVAQQAPLRITLVWTDPPGNPAATINLVNDLDLIVTNIDTGEVYFGNNFTGSGDFSDVNMLTSNSVPVLSTGVTNDFINNVENVYLNAPLGSNYAIRVSARRVNVNAVIAHTNDIVQDYALVISSGNTSITNAFTVSPAAFAVDTNVPLTILDIGSSDSTNAITGNRSRGAVIEAQQVGANPSMMVSTNGTNLQWRFYVVTNATTFTNAIFSLFAAPTLSVARNISDPYAVVQALGPNSGLPLGRNVSADLDLYVSTNSAITNLDDLAVGQAYKSLDRFSEEAVILTNSNPNDVYYIGVKSEDQQGGEFSLGVVFLSNSPYLLNPDGSMTMELPFANYVVPDGSPDQPGGAVSLPIPGPANFQVGGAVLQDQFTHENFGDLVGLLHHGSKSVYLNTHNSFLQGQFSGTVSNTYDDLSILTNAPLNLTPSDGPGDLSDFLGEKGSGMWQFYMIDNALSYTGRVEGVVLTLFPQFTNNPGKGTSGKLFSGTVKPGQSLYGALIVPASAISLELQVAIPSGSEGPLELYVRRDDGSSPRLPGPNNYDYTKTIFTPGGSLTIGRSDIPPLIAGTYIVGIYCPVSSPTTTFDVFYNMTIDLAETGANKLVDTNLTIVLDEAFTNSLTSQINVNLPTNQIVSDVRVGLRVDHPRISDLVFHLISPEGTSVLLAENRGHDSTNGFGLGTNANEFAYTTFSEATNLAFTPIKFATNASFLEFIPPLLVATNYMEDTTNTPAASHTGGTANEDTTFVYTGTNTGSITISYNFYSAPDRMRIYYDGALVYDTGSVSFTNTFTYNYSGFSDYLIIVMNEGSTTSGTVWDYSYTLNPLPPAGANKNQRATGAWIVDNNLFISGMTEANVTNAIVARYGLPMQDNALPIWELNWPDFKGGTPLNGVAATANRVYVAGSSYSLTLDDKSDGVKQTKGITAAFPVNNLDTNGFIYGSLWHMQTPASPGAFTNVGGFEQLHAITVESTTNIYVTGDGQSSSTNFGRLFISKLDPLGNILWTTNDLGASTTTNYSSGKAITTMNGFIYVAGANADSGITNPCLKKFDSDGNIIWSQVTPIAGEFRGVATYGGYLYTVGVADLTGTNAFFIQKWDDAGSSIWTNQMSLNGISDELNCVVGYADRLYAAGSTSIGGTNRDVVLLEISQATGALITNATYTGITTYDGGVAGDDVASGIATDGLDLYLVGETHHYTNRVDSDVLVLRYQIKNDYIPEEPLSLFTGEYANGDWRLQIWDNRAESPVNTGKLLGWQLQLTLAATNNSADILTHDVPFYSSISGKHPMRYFIVNVPYTASKATFALTNLSGGNLNLWFDQNQLPTPGVGSRTILLSNITAATASIDNTTPTVPMLLPGQRCYVGVEYTGTGTNDFIIEVTFDNNALTFLAGGDSASGSFGGGNTANNLYQFRVDPNDPPKSFQLQNLTGDVEVYLRRGGLATSSAYDYHQSFVGTNFGQVIIQSTPQMPDFSGSWFVSIAKLTTNSVAYNVVVTNANRSPIFGALNNQTATEGTLLSFTVPVTEPDGQQVTFSLDSGAPAGATINANTGVFSWTPTASQGPSSNAITIRVTDNGVPPSAATKTISIIVNDKVPVFAAPAVVSGKLQITWSSLAGQNYEVQTSTNLVNWTPIATNSASGNATTYLDQDSGTNKVHKFYRVRPVP